MLSGLDSLAAIYWCSVKVTQLGIVNIEHVSIGRSKIIILTSCNSGLFGFGLNQAASRATHPWSLGTGQIWTKFGPEVIWRNLAEYFRWKIKVCAAVYCTAPLTHVCLSHEGWIMSTLLQPEKSQMECRNWWPPMTCLCWQWNTVREGICGRSVVCRHMCYIFKTKCWITRRGASIMWGNLFFMIFSFSVSGLHLGMYASGH